MSLIGSGPLKDAPSQVLPPSKDQESEMGQKGFVWLHHHRINNFKDFKINKLDPKALFWMNFKIKVQGIVASVSCRCLCA